MGPNLCQIKRHGIEYTWVNIQYTNCKISSFTAECKLVNGVRTRKLCLWNQKLTKFPVKLLNLGTMFIFKNMYAVFNYEQEYRVLAG